jgi:hypothetical protein
LDESIVPPKIQEQLVESFVESVNSKVAEITEKLETEYIDKEIAMEKKYTKKIENFYESERNHIANYLDELRKEMNETLISKYADEVLVEDALTIYRRMQNVLSESLSKLNVNPIEIDENIKLKNTINRLENSIRQKDEKLNNVSRFAVIKEHHDSITNPKLRQQFSKLAEEISFDGDVKSFDRKLERIKENLEKEYKSIVESIKRDVVVKENQTNRIKHPTTPIKKEVNKMVDKNERLQMIKESIKKRNMISDLIIEEVSNTDKNISDDVSVYN